MLPKHCLVGFVVWEQTQLPPPYKSLVINDLDTYGIQNRMARFSSAKELKRAVLRVYLNTQT